MPRRLLLILLTLTCSAGLTRAQQITAATPVPQPAKATAQPVRASAEATPAVTRLALNATPAPAAAPAPNRPGLFDRIFRRSTPMPVATPAPNTPRVWKNKGRRTPKPEKPDTTPGKPDEVEKATPVPRVTTRVRPGGDAGTTKPEVSSDPEKAERAKYKEVKAQADADPHVRELREKSDNAANEDEGRAALKAYNKALFQKMRTLDPSLEPRIERMETAVMSKLEPKNP